MVRFFAIAVFTALLAASGAQAVQAQSAQQIGDTRMGPVLNGCPAGMVMNKALAACVAVAPNGCCAPNPPRAVCAHPAPGGARWSGNPNDLRSQAVVCPR
ncbi:MAG: hypothetical protein WBQ17_15275 [Rhizomicrobium sp.]